MKKIGVFISIMIMICIINACGKTDTETMQGESEQTEKQITEKQTGDTEKNEKIKQEGQKRILIAYFSWAENAVQDSIDAMTSASVTDPGNVAQLASWVSEKTGGELFSIQVEEPYPADWDDCLERANQEKKDGTHPKLKNTIEKIEDYDTIYLGYPNWWYSCPMAIFSFLDEYDLSGKQVYLFCSHGTGGLASSVKDISAAISNAEISENVFDAYEEDTASSKEDLIEWLDSISE